MSTQEQMAAIGGLVTERTEARRKLALLAREIRDTGSALYNAGQLLMRELVIDLNPGMKIINEVASRGGLGRLKEATAEYQATKARIDELSKSLQEAGAE